MRNVVICCDGTWNTPEQMDNGLPAPTNVVKLYNALEKDKNQIAYYHPGVGTGKGWWDHVVGGSTGEGLDRNIMSAYRWLAGSYAKDDRIFMFGFSRGAYTVRSLAGLISDYGLLDLSNLEGDPNEVWNRVGKVFSAYRNSHAFENTDRYAFHNAATGVEPAGKTKIHFVGVWDTVGALGIPEDFALLGLFDRPDRYRFHDTTLSELILNARHAVAIDERRASFEPTLWSGVDDRDTAKQVWFPGVHGDVGGGYVETGLSDGALDWMLTEAKTCGLAIRSLALKQIRPDLHGIAHDSCSGVFKMLKTQPRAVPCISNNDQAHLHKSTRGRQADPPLSQGDYWKRTELDSGQSVSISVFAAEQWNRTGLFLEAGIAYQFEATGQWIDDKDKFSQNGKPAAGFHMGDIGRLAGSALGEAEKAFQAVTHNRQADFWWTKRFESAPWFSLIGFLASEFGKNERMLPTGEMFEIGSGTSLIPKCSGYLYCFANDAWQAYHNNHGSVSLKVSRPKE